MTLLSCSRPKTGLVSLGAAILLLIGFVTPVKPAHAQENSSASPAADSLDERGCPEEEFYKMELRQNYSLAAEFSRNEDHCAAYVYLNWVMEEDPLFTTGEPDDRNFRRLAEAYEAFAQNQQDEARRKAYLDSALATLEAGRQAMREAGVQPEDSWQRDLFMGLFYDNNGDVFEEGESEIFNYYRSAFEAAPDSLNDYYLRQLVERAATEIEEFPARSAFLDSVAQHFDDSEYQNYTMALADYDPEAAAGPGFIYEGQREEYVSKFNAGSLSDDEEQRLLFFSIQYPEMLEEAGGDPETVRDSLFERVIDPEDISTAKTAFAVAVMMWQRGNSEKGEGFFNQALTLAESNSQRADFYYSRGALGYGNKSEMISQALRYEPAHGPSLYAQAQSRAQAVGQPGSIEGRAAYWCLADAFNRVAATGDPRVADAARQAAAGYLRAAPSREEYFFQGWRPGMRVTAANGCSTTVR